MTEQNDSVTPQHNSSSSATLCRDEGQMRRTDAESASDSVVMWSRDLAKVTLPICPRADSQQSRGGSALGAGTYHCLGANSEGPNAGRGEKQKGTETSLTHSVTRLFQHNKHDGKRWLFLLSAHLLLGFLGFESTEAEQAARPSVNGSLCRWKFRCFHSL